MIIAISSLSGCGNTTVSDLVAKKLGLKKINYTFRDLATDKGVSFEQLRETAVKEFPSVDRELDKKLIEMTTGDCVVGTRLAVWLLDADLTVWLTASPKKRAARIAQREGHAPDVKALKERDDGDSERYKKLYGVRVKKHADVCDIEVNTEYIPAEKVADLIACAAKQLPFDKKNRKWHKKIVKILKG